MPKKPTLVTHRDDNNQVAVVFIHGFGGHPGVTWGEFPQFLMADSRLKNWDVFSLGYATGPGLDIVGIWQADPELAVLAGLLNTACSLEPLDRYRSLALVAHSMGGLIAQRALVDHLELASRVGHVVLFGTPSGGLVKAGFIPFWKRQVRDMARDGEFIRDLRSRWKVKFAQKRFRFWAVAGDQDQFVPPDASIAPFPEAERAVVPGNHLQIVKPRDAESLSVQLLLKALVGDAAPAGPGNAARVAVEDRDFHQAVELLEPRHAELDEAALVQLALALDSLGRRDNAIRYLESRPQLGTDPMGVLAGRLKRRWLVERREADADRAMELYSQAYRIAQEAGKPAQAFYHGINVAFMQLAYQDDRAAAAQTAREVLAHCLAAAGGAAAPQPVPDVWRLATEGEARLYLGDYDGAVDSYRQAVGLNPEPWQHDSMYQQAILVAGILREKSTALRLEQLFRPGP